MSEEKFLQYAWVTDNVVLLTLVVATRKKSLKITIFDTETASKVREKLKELSRNDKYINHGEDPIPGRKYATIFISCEYGRNENWATDFKEILDDLIGLNGVEFNN